MTLTCLTCRHFHSDINTKNNYIGECRILPPDVPYDRPSSNGTVYTYRRVYLTAPCGKYEVLVTAQDVINCIAEMAPRLGAQAEDILNSEEV